MKSLSLTDNCESKGYFVMIETCGSNADVINTLAV